MQSSLNQATIFTKSQNEHHNHKIQQAHNSISTIQPWKTMDSTMHVIESLRIELKHHMHFKFIIGLEASLEEQLRTGSRALEEVEKQQVLRWPAPSILPFLLQSPFIFSLTLFRINGAHTSL